MKRLTHKAKQRLTHRTRRAQRKQMLDHLYSQICQPRPAEKALKVGAILAVHGKGHLRALVAMGLMAASSRGYP